MSIHWQNNSILSHDEWLLSRNNSIGASEVGAIVLGNKFTSSLEIFYNKVAAPKTVSENLRMLIGTETEELSSKFWKYYDDRLLSKSDRQNSIVTNLRNKTPVKDCEYVNGTAFNSDYPHLSATPDRKILPVLRFEGMGFGSLEIKNSQQMVLDSYEFGIPTDNLFQNIAQMIVTTWKYGELFYFLDNRSVDSYLLHYKDAKRTANTIIETTTAFWKNVLLARPLYNQMCKAKRDFNMKLAAELEVEIARLEPAPQATAGYMSYLNQRYIDKMQGVAMIPGNEAQLALARKDKAIDGKIAKLEKEKSLIQLELKNIIKESQGIDFGKNGKITWYVNKAGNRSFKNQTK